MEWSVGTDVGSAESQFNVPVTSYPRLGGNFYLSGVVLVVDEEKRERERRGRIRWRGEEEIKSEGWCKEK